MHIYQYILPSRPGKHVWSPKKEGTLWYHISLSFACLPNLIFTQILPEPFSPTHLTTACPLPTIRQPTISATPFLGLISCRLPTSFRNAYQHVDTHRALPFHNAPTGKSYSTHCKILAAYGIFNPRYNNPSEPRISVHDSDVPSHLPVAQVVAGRKHLRDW